MPRPRVLLVGNFLSARRGSRSVIEDLSDRLRGAGQGVVCVSSWRSGWMRGLHFVGAAIAKRRAYDVAVVDLYSGRGFRWGELAARVLTSLRCPFVFVLRGGGLAAFARRHPDRVRRCLGRANRVVAPSAFLAEGLRACRDDIAVLPNPLEIDRYEYRTRVRPRPRLVWLRAFQTFYNPAMAPKVAAALRPAFADVRLVMAGPDKGDGSRAEVAAIAKELGVADVTSVTGGVAKRDVPAVLNQGDIFLNTTNADNTPVSVLEAMACGLCVVSTNVGGIPYMLTHEQDALLVPPDDPPAMAAAVRRVLTEPGLAARLSHNGRTRVEPFDWTFVLPQWDALLQSLQSEARR